MEIMNNDILECPVCWGGGKIEYDDFGNDEDCHYCNGKGYIKPKKVKR